MKNYLGKARSRISMLMLKFMVACFIFSSCKDGFFEEVNEPSWLGSSIYEYLQKGGSYKNYLRLVDDLNYGNVLMLTGSKTIFVADDDAFDRFFKKNGISGYNQLSLAQKKLILNYGMVNDAYLMETFSNYYDGTLHEGSAIRRASNVSPLDSLAHEFGEALPSGPYWNKYRTRGIYFLRDNTNSPMVYFTEKNMELDAITNGDFQLFTGLDRANNDVHIFKNRIDKRDITCKNGYVNLLSDVMLPPANMAQFIHENQTTQTFSNLLDRFSAPYYDVANTLLYKQLHPEFTDSIFTKRYFSNSSSTGGTKKYPDDAFINTQFLLPFDPGWNSYRSTVSNSLVSLESDMAAMFVPNDETMNAYFNSGTGSVLKERYGSWDNVPNDILALLIKRHMRNSFIQSVPSRFSKMIDSENSPLLVTGGDIVDNYVGVNGVVYITNKVYPPDDYVSIYGPILFSEKTKIYNWAIIQNDYRLYINSLISKYSFFVPTDTYFTNYIDPIAYGKDMPAALKFWYNSKTLMVNATIYKYNKISNTIGDSIGMLAPTGTSESSYNFIKNRLLDLLDSHIVVGDVESGKGYYMTKGNNFIKVSGLGNDMKIKGGGDFDLGTQASVLNTYSQVNGKTYFIDKPIQTPLKSVYQVFSTTPEFSEFFALLSGFPSTSNSVIFVHKTNYFGIDFNIKFFNTYNYTVYVPTNDAIQKAIADKLITPWVSQNGIVGINDMTDATAKNAAIAKLERFLRYHFQDNSLFISGQPIKNTTYQSATMKLDNASTNFNTYINKFYRIGASGDGTNLNLTTEYTALDYVNNPPHVITTSGLYNIMTRDYVFNADPKQMSEVNVANGTYTSSTITTSSTAVIHQISNVLRFQ